MTLTTLGIFLATIGATFYTTASDAMVSPKLKFDKWHPKKLEGQVRASFGNINATKSVCPTVFGRVTTRSDSSSNRDACLHAWICAESFPSLMDFMSNWRTVNDSLEKAPEYMEGRPVGMNSYNNVTLQGAWIETKNSNVTAKFEEYGRLINNVTMAIPHLGVARAAQVWNAIMQPDELGGVGQYEIRAAVVSPTINVMCASVGEEELAPLVYVKWPHSQKERSNYSDQEIPIHKDTWDQWAVPNKFGDNGERNYYNRTVLDDIFQWGPKYERYPPVFSTVSSQVSLTP
jgi:hypothetical protein